MNDQEETLNTESCIKDIHDFKTNVTRTDRRKRLKFFIQKYKDHMALLKTVKPTDTDSSKEEIDKSNDFIGKHIIQANTLRRYILAFIPKSYKRDLIVFNNLTVYYDGKEL